MRFISIRCWPGVCSELLARTQAGVCRSRCQTKISGSFWCSRNQENTDSLNLRRSQRIPNFQSQYQNYSVDQGRKTHTNIFTQSFFSCERSLGKHFEHQFLPIPFFILQQSLRRMCQPLCKRKCFLQRAFRECQISLWQDQI